jgi:translation initiation factor IF-2
MMTKKEARNLNIGKTQNENIVIKSTPHSEKKKEDDDDKEIFIKNAFFLETSKDKNLTAQKKNELEKIKQEPEVIKAKLPGLKVLDKIDLDAKKTTKFEQKPSQLPNNKQNIAHKENLNFQEKPFPKEEVIKTNEIVELNHDTLNNEQTYHQQVLQKESENQPLSEQQTPILDTNNNTNTVETIAEPTQKIQVEKTIKQPNIEFDDTKIVVSDFPTVQLSSLDDTTNVEFLTIGDEDNFDNVATEEMEKDLITENDVRNTTTVSDMVKASKNNKKKGVELIEEPEVTSNTQLIEAKAQALPGLKILGKIELPDPRGAKKKQKPVASSDDHLSKDKRKRKRKRKDRDRNNTGDKPQQQPQQDQVKRDEPKKDAKGNHNNNNINRHTGNNNNNNNKNSNNNNNSNNKQNNNNSPNNKQNNNNSPNNKQNNNSNNNNNNSNNNNSNNNNNRHRNKPIRDEISDKEIQDKIKNTLAILNTNNKGGKQTIGRKQKKAKVRDANARNQQLLQADQDRKLVKVAEFISANDLANLLSVSVNEVISKCLSFGMFIAINQRLDAEAITFIADEFGYEVEFISAAQDDVQLEQEDKEEDLATRAPIVTIMGHVDHGKTSLLDYIRKSNITQGEAGGITQHIGAYDVVTSSGKRITFLDTPGHEAFTAMRARGAKLTDIAVIVVSADDSVMPQTIEAINHAQIAAVPMVFAINKIDKADANPAKIKEQLANMNILVEDWGGKYQCQEISAKKGIGIEDLLEKILLEAEFLNLKANPSKNASGTVVEASLDKGKGYLATILVQTGTLKAGDMVLAGSHYGRVKAMLDHRGKKLPKAGPSMPVQILGLNGAPQAGDKFNVTTEREAKEIATKRDQILREQSIRAIKRTTLQELGRRIALGHKHLNIIVKADVDGSVEALSDSLLKLSKEEVEVQIIHKGVGQISEADVTLATAADAIIIGFQVRPSPNARKLVEKEGVEVRLYSIIYDAINDVKDALEGMLAPTIEEVILGNAEVREVFKISKIGMVAGCYITEGSIKRNAKVRLIRDGIVIYGGGENSNGEISALKRFKDDVNEVKTGFECGMSLRNFNNIQVGDVIEAYEQKEVKRKL